MIQLDQITVYASEAQGPSITPVADPGSLWAQTGHWIWNAPGNSWPLDVSAGDASGVCSLTVAGWRERADRGLITAGHE